jgi:hypothetical protein
MGQYMNERLNHFCESLYRTRQKVNKLKQDEKGDLQGAQEEMLRPGSGGKGKTCEIYVYAGIRLRIKPGVAKISCELVDETGVAEGPREPKRGRSRRGEEDTQVDATSAEPSAAASEDEDEETGESD